MAEREPFLERWSRRKAAAAIEPEPPDGDPAPAPAADAAPELPDLPEIDSLDRESDFSVFMQDGVPASLRRQALRRLWCLDPAFAECDGLVEYGEDYAATVHSGAVVRTAWRLGRGMPDPAGDAESVTTAAEECDTEEDEGCLETHGENVATADVGDTSGAAGYLAEEES